MKNYFEENAVSKLLIIRLSSLGDILLTTPLVRTVKEKYPQISIDFLLREEYGDVYKYNPHINSILLYKEGSDNLVSKLRDESYDLVLDLQNNLRSYKLTRLLKTRVLKFRKKHLDKFLLVNFKINRLKDAAPIAVRYAESIPGFTLDEKGLEIFTNSNQSAREKSISKAIGFCPGSRHFTKMYPEEYFIRLGNLLTSKGYQVILFGGRSDFAVCNRISSSLPGSINLCNDNQMLVTACDMQNCLCVVCNDSGLMHLACAVNVPVVTIFGSSVKEFGFFPYRSGKSLILENNFLSCRPCSHIGREECPEKHFKCMREIVPEAVSERIDEFLQ